MSFTPTQQRKLKARLNPAHVRSRIAEGQILSYLEGWHVIAEANRIFGFEGWDRETLASTCVYSKQIGERYCAAYAARVRITVRAGERVIIREGSGAGEANVASPGQAHEVAAKAAETDATKRALMTFGNAFGLSLYKGLLEPAERGGRTAALLAAHSQPPATGNDKRHAGSEGTRDNVPIVGKAGAVPVPQQPTPSAPPVPEVPRAAPPDRAADEDRIAPDHRAAGDDTAAGQTRTVGADHAAIETATPKPQPSGQETPIPSAHENPEPAADASPPTALVPAPVTGVLSAQVPQGHIDKSALTRSEPRRVRDAAHLRFVASHPCFVCGRQPTHAHHLKFTQAPAMSRKVSDEFTVPLCALHHRELHDAGHELSWWQRRKLDPVKLALSLWEESRRGPKPVPETAQEVALNGSLQGW